jgi:hypothetical protein
MSSPLLAARREAAARLNASDAGAFLTRLDLLESDLLDPLSRLYGDEHDLDALAARLVSMALDTAVARLTISGCSTAGGDRPDVVSAVRRRELCVMSIFAGTLDGVDGSTISSSWVSATYTSCHSTPRPGDSDCAVADYATSTLNSEPSTISAASPSRCDRGISSSTSW